MFDLSHLQAPPQRRLADAQGCADGIPIAAVGNMTRVTLTPISTAAIRLLADCCVAGSRGYEIIEPHKTKNAAKHAIK
ncbi:hypothetical protein ABIC76_000838 [Ralstonia sp. 1138]